MKVLRALAWRNPVLMRELNVPVESRRFAVGSVLALLSLIGVVLAAAWARREPQTIGTGQPGVTQLADLGQSLFEFVLFFVLLLVLIIVPGYLAPSIATEREQQTLLPLQLSTLRPRKIVLGKLLAATAYISLLVAATLPVVMVAYLVGGLTPGAVAVGLGAVALTGVATACITLGCAAWTRSSHVAVVVAYAVVIALVAGTLLAHSLATEIGSERGGDRTQPSTWYLAANPFAAVADLAGERTTVSSQPNFPIAPTQPFGSPIRTVRELMHLDQSNQFDPFGPFGPFGPDVRFDQFGRPIVDDEDAADTAGLPLWARSGIVLGSMSIVGVGLAIRSVNCATR